MRWSIVYESGVRVPVSISLAVFVNRERSRPSQPIIDRQMEQAGSQAPQKGLHGPWTARTFSRNRNRGLVGRNPFRVIDRGAARSGHVTRKQGVVGLVHPTLETLPHLRQGIGVP